MAELSDEDVNRIAEAVVEKAAEGVGSKNICKCVDWLLVATTAAEALEHNATVSDMAKDLHENLKQIIPEKQLEDLEFKHVLLQGYLTENFAEMALAGSLGSIRSKCDVDISAVKELADNGFEAVRRRDPVMAAENFTRVKVELLKMAGNICGRKEDNPGELERAMRETPGLASSRYITKKLDTWRAIDKCTFKKAYEGGDWKTVNELTPDLTGSAYSRQRTLSDLYSVLQEQKCE